MQTKKIEEYTFVDFCVALAAATKEGYEIDLTSNATVPIGSPGYYKCLLVKKAAKEPALFQPKPEPVEEVKQEPAPEVKPFVPSITFEVQQQPKKTGRKPREAV